mgnify:CR=1 FL=1
MYRVIITGNPDGFSESAMARNFTRRGLIRFLSRHVYKFVDYEDVAVTHGGGPECFVNLFLVGKKHMSDRIPTCRIILPWLRDGAMQFFPHMDKGGDSAPGPKRRKKWS